MVLAIEAEDDDSLLKVKRGEKKEIVGGQSRQRNTKDKDEELTIIDDHNSNKKMGFKSRFRHYASARQHCILHGDNRLL